MNDDSKIMNEENLQFAMISIISKKLRVLVVGSGKAGLLKAKYFLDKGCKVEILTKEIKLEEECMFLKKYGNNSNISVKEYKKDFILDKHIIIIAVNDISARDEIRRDCEELSKIYIDSTDFREGMAVVPVQKESNNVVIALNTKGGNPKGAVFLGEIIKDNISRYDEFINFTTLIRNKLKDKPNIKKEVLNFMFTNDFLFFFEKGLGMEVLKIFYGEV